MSYLGDIRLSDTLDVKFMTALYGAPITLAGTPVVSAYVGNDLAQITAGITLTVDFDGVTGLHNVRVVASGANGYATATNVNLVVTTGTVNGTSVAGLVVGSFSIENRSAVMPTTAARTLDVSAGGEAGVDWANVGSPTTAVGLTGTTGLTLAATTGLGNQTANITGNLSGSVGSVGVGGIAATTFAAGAIDAAAIAANAIGASEIATDAIDADALAADAVTEIWGKAIAELAQAAPSATPSVLNALALLYMAARNQITVTASTKSFTNDAGTVVFKKALSDDGTTYTEAEAVSGP